MSTLDRWDDIYGDTSYMEISVDEDDKYCVFVKCIWKDEDDYTAYIMQCENGYEVYEYGIGADYGIRNLTDDEKKEVMAWVVEQFDVEREMDEYEQADI